VELDHVEAFVAIVRRGGFTRASATLHLSQPAISRRVHLLERELGAPLFERVRNGAILTDAGRTFLPHAEALLASMRDGIEAVGGLRGAERGSVTLAAVGTLTSTALTERLRRFRETHPAIELRLRTSLSSEISALVRRGDATLGLRYDIDPHPELVCTPVYEERLVPVCAPDHRLARAQRVVARDLAGERWLAFPPRPAATREPYASALEHRLAAFGLHGAELIHIDSLTAQKRMVEAGFGLALLQESSVDEELRAGSLRVLRIPSLSVTIPVVLIHRRRAYLSGAARALMAILTAWSPTTADGRGSRRRAPGGSRSRRNPPPRAAVPGRGSRAAY
jgi:DNA-binding transcriptional LysR family regulator